MALFMLSMVGIVNASHYAGEDITIDNLGNNQYRITQKVYRDCRGILLGASQTASLTNLLNNSTQALNQPQTSQVDITPLCPGQSTPCPGGIGNTVFGLEEHIYSSIVTLAAGINYRVSVSNSARNGAITTGAANQLMYVYANFTTTVSNSSPRFLNRPVGTFCANQPAVLSPNGFDPDGDAILYTLQSCYQANGTSVTYNPGFSATVPLNSSTGINLNPNTGALSFTPTIPGQVAVICLRADEYRNGVLIGSVVRDMQVNIVGCNNAPPVIAPLPNVVVNVGQTYCVNVSATDANNNNITLTAVSGIIPPGTFVQNTNNPGSATGTFCFTPNLSHVGNTYTVSINGVDNACPSPGTGVGSFNITVPIPCNMTATASGTNAACGLSTGTATVAVTNGTAPITYSWTGPLGFTSFNQSISNLAPGTYNVLVVDGNSCVANASYTVVANGSTVTATAVSTPASCGGANGTVSLVASGGTAPYQYSLDGGASQSSGSFSGVSAGLHTYSVVDANGCGTTGTVTVGQSADVTPPTISCPGNISVGNDPGLCGAAVTFGNAVASDNCGAATVVQTSGSASGTFLGLGTSTVSFTAVDGSGNTAACSFTITVADNEPPTLTCGNAGGLISRLGFGASTNSGESQNVSSFDNDVTLPNDPGLCSALYEYDNEALDNCPGVTVTQIAGLPTGSNFPAGTTLNTFIATDAAGNSTSCSFVVTVTDAEAPVVTCPTNITVNNTAGQCSANVSYQVNGSDNCPGVTVAQSGGLASGSSFPLGTTTNSYVATDASGNTAACSFTVTVTDGEAPSLSCPSNLSVSNDQGICGAAVTYTVSGSDNCPGVTTSLVSGGASGSTFPVGTSTVVYQATDGAGNTATCSFNVTVVDAEAPTLTCGNAAGLISRPNHGTVSLASFDNDVTLPNDPGQCSALFEYDNEALDNCPGVTIAQVAGLPSGSSFPIGVTLNTFVATDASGNTTSCSFEVTVTDAEGPSITCPANITRNNDPGQCAAVVSYSATASDNCPGVTVSLSPASGGSFPVGTTTVTATATDASGNQAACSFIVTVVDAEAPMAICQNVTLSLDNSGNASVTAQQVDNGSTDNCGIASISVSPTSYNCSSVVNGGATDLFFSEYVEGSSNNKCLEIFNGTGAAVNLGTYAIQMYFNGANTSGLTIGLSGTLADGDVYVVCQSSAASQFTSAADLLNGGSWYNGDDAVVLTNNGNAIDIIGRIGEDPGTAWTGGGNSTLDRTLVRNANVNSGNNSNSTGFPSLGSEWTGLAVNTSSNLGSHTMSASGGSATLTVTDVNGNTSTCTASVTVLDLVPPTALCQNITVSVSGNGTASVSAGQVNNGSTDNCGIASITVNPNSFGCANVGANNSVVLTVTDLSGNISTCSANVTVNETTPPTALCQNLTVQLDGNGQASITAGQINNGSSDNCGIQNLSVSPSTFNCSNVVTGANTISNLFISEYIEGSGNNKCIEIFNGTGAAVNLSGYQLQFYFNGSNTANTTINLTGTVASGDVFVVCSASASATFTGQADQLSGSSFFNGDDAVVLVQNNVSIDVFGRIGEDPGTGWTVSGNQTLDRTLVRNSSVTSGNTANASGFPSLGTEWAQFGIDYSGSLGTHSVGTGSPVVTLTVTDVNGNSATCTATVTVQDNIAPAITCPANISVSTDLGVCGAAVSHSATATDNCSAVVSQASGLASGSTFPVGTSTVSYSAIDPSGNTAACSFTVTVTDNEAPVIVCPSNISVSTDLGVCGAAVNHGATATDNCSAVVSQTSGLASGSTFPVGTSTVSYSAIDPSGNTAACSFTVTVTDNEAPVIVCPSNINVNNDLGVCGAAVSHSATATDNCSAVVSQASGLASGATFPVGTSTVSYSAIDPSGNTAACSFTVTVTDGEAPSVSCPANITVNNDPGQCGAAVSYSVSGADNCPGVTVSLVSGGASGSTFSVGTSSVSYLATDGAGNTAACSFTVTVNDSEAPSVTCPANISVVGCTSVVNYSVTGSDNCPGVTVALVSGGASGSTFPLGTSTVVYSATDASGNTATCSFTVTVSAPPINVSLTSPLNGCGYNVSSCCNTNGGGGSGSGSGSGNGSGSGSNGSGSGSNGSGSGSNGSGHGDHGSNGSHNDGSNGSNGSHGSGSGTGNYGHGHCNRNGITNNGNCGGNHGTHGGNGGSGHFGSGHGNGGHGHGGSGHGNCGSGHGHGGSGHGNCGSGHGGSGHGHGGCGGGNTNPCGQDGVINLTANGGCGNLTYLWSNGATTANLTGLTPGLYIVTVTDANGNTSTASITLTQASLLSVTTTVQNISCYGSRNGAVTANGAGGCAPYTYNWSNGAHTQTISGLNPGTYTVTIVDGNGCTATASGTVTQPARLVVDAGAHKVVYPAYAPRACATLTGTVSGGTPAYNARWTTRTGTLLASGTTYSACPTVTTVYYFRVTDANGCTAVDSVAVCPQNISCGNNKINICHVTPGRYGCQSTMCVSISQVATHLNHGDQLGACGHQANCTFPRSNNGNCGNGNHKAAAGSESDAPTVAMRAFPNPTSGALTIELACQNCNTDASYTVKVSNVYGQLMSETEVTISAGEASTKLDLSQYAAGVYMITVSNGDQQLVERVVKQ